MTEEDSLSSISFALFNPALGGHIVFCVDRYNEGSTMEQIDLKTARSAIDCLRKINGGRLS